MALVTKTYTFTAGTTIVASEHNTNFDTLYNLVNGNIDNANIKASAGIVDSKLAQIATAGKVSGASFTSLTSVPSGAGLIPVANIDTGTTANKILKLNGSAQIPAVSGALLTNIGGLVGTSVSKSVDTIYQAATDGFVSYCATLVSGDQAILHTDSATPPTEVVQQLVYNGSSTLRGNIMYPIKKNNYYKITIAGGSPTLIALNFIPLGA